MGSLSKVSIKRPVTTVMVLLIVLMTGAVSLLGLKLDMMPSMDIPVALVSTTYVGAGPEEVEQLITKPIESSVGTIANIKELSSTSSSNSSMVMIQFEDGTDIDMAAIDLREKVDMIKGTLPEDADDPMVLKLDINALTSSLYVGISCDKMDLAQLNTLLDENVVNRLERIEGVASVSLAGGLEKEIEIVVNPDKMQGYGISTSQITQLLAAENSNFPTGKISQGDTKLQIRAVGEFQSIEEIRQLPITTAGGSVIHLEDVASIQEVNQEMSSYALINGKQSIMMIVQKQSNANTVDISDKVSAELTKIQRDYPDFDVEMLSDTADYIKTSINNVIKTAIEAALMAIVILFIFLRDPKTSFIIGISIPTSVIATFSMMYLSGMTMNIISMGGVTLGIGMLVDNSVVVLENIYKHWKNGMDPKVAAEVGAGEVGMAVFASTLTTLAVFIPLMFVSGTIGQLFKDLSLTITFALSASLIVSLTFVPMACSRLLNHEENRVKKGKNNIFSKLLDIWGKGLESLDVGYRKALVWSLCHKKRVLAIVLAAFIGTGALLPMMGVDLMPATDEGSASISIEMPKGTVLEETQKIVEKVLKEVDQIPELETVYAMVGGGGFGAASADTATVAMNLVKKEARERSTDQIVEELRPKLLQIPGAEIKISASSSAMGSYGGGDIGIQLNGEDTDTLRAIGNDIVNLVSEISGITEVTSSSEDAIPEANITLNRAKASTYGLTAGSVASAINTAVSGTVATQYKVNGTEIDIRVRQNKDSIKYVTDLKNINITTPTGAVVPLTEVADITMKDSAVSITRKNQHKYITVTAKVIGRDLRSVQTDLNAKMAGYIFPDGYDYEYTGSMEDMAESYFNLMIVLVVAILLVYMIMASQFESLIHPFIVMFSVPLSITGGIFGLFVTGKTISVTAFMGFIMLVGTVVNNAIVLIDYTNQLMEKGMDCNEALVEAGPNRLRPILMTTLTTVLGLMPMAMSTAEGTEMQQPLAISVIFGLSISTLVTLIFIPVLYAIVDKLRFQHRRKKKMEKMKGRRKETRKEMLDKTL